MMNAQGPTPHAPPGTPPVPPPDPSRPPPMTEPPPPIPTPRQDPPLPPVVDPPRRRSVVADEFEHRHRCLAAGYRTVEARLLRCFRARTALRRAGRRLLRVAEGRYREAALCNRFRRRSTARHAG